MEDRDFKGIWIPKEIWFDDRLSIVEKGILMEINSLDSTEKRCYASNEYLANFCQCSESTVSRAISKLIALNFIGIDSFDGRTRRLKSNIKYVVGDDDCGGRVVKLNTQPRQFDEAASSNLLPRNIDKKNSEKYTQNKERKKTTYDVVMDECCVSESLREALLDFIKMRTVIKKPLTDKALKMTITKVRGLSSDEETQIEIINQSVMNSWQGVFPLKDDNGKKKQEKKGREIIPGYF